MTAPTPSSTADDADGTPTVTPGRASYAEGPLVSRQVVAVSSLIAHPGNVRRDLELEAAFVTSIAEAGILVPLRITPDDGSYRVIDGHRRLAAAIEVGMIEVPYELAEDRAGDEAAQFLDMFVVNHHRRDHKPLEEADALFAASQAGASKTRIRKTTGLGKDRITAALAAGKLSDEIREKADVGYDLNLEQYALLTEFQDDPGAVNELLRSFRLNESGQHAAELIRTRHAAEAERERLLVQWHDQGYQVTDSVPEGAMPVQFLLHDGQDLTPEAHGDCHGRGIVFYPWDPSDPLHYCTDPSANGHQSRYAASPPAPTTGQTSVAGPADENGTTSVEARPADSSADAPSRRLVVQGNRAWIAAAAVRRRWLDAMFARRSAPKEAPLFIASQLISMPGPLRNAMTRAPHLPLFGELIGHPGRDNLSAWPVARLPMIPLAVIVTAYEDQMGGESGKTPGAPMSIALAIPVRRAPILRSWLGRAMNCPPSSVRSPTAFPTPETARLMTSSRRTPRRQGMASRVLDQISTTLQNQPPSATWTRARKRLSSAWGCQPDGSAGTPKLPEDNSGVLRSPRMCIA